MRTVNYILSDGTKVSGYTEAKQSGKPFKTVLENIVAEGSKISPLHKAMLKQFGYVSPKFKDSIQDS